MVLVQFNPMGPMDPNLVLQVSVNLLLAYLLWIAGRGLVGKLTRPSLLRARTIPAFASERRSATALQMAAKKLSNVDLHWAYLLPDHTAAAKQAVTGRAIGLMLVAALALLSISIVGYRNVCARFLLLRPFGDRSMTMPLRRLITQKVGHFGVVYTLSDHNYMPNIAASYLRRKWGPLGHIFAVLVRDSIRVIEVSSERNFLKLSRRLMRKIRPSAATVCTGGRL